MKNAGWLSESRCDCETKAGIGRRLNIKGSLAARSIFRGPSRRSFARETFDIETNGSACGWGFFGNPAAGVICGMWWMFEMCFPPGFSFSREIWRDARVPRRRQIDSLVPSETFLHPAFFPSSRSPDFFQRLIFYPFFSFLFFSFFRIIVSIYRIYLDNFFLIYRSLRCIIYLGNFFYLSSPSIYYIFGQFSFRFIVPCDISYIWIIFFYLSFPSIYFIFGQFFLFIVPFDVLYIWTIFFSIYRSLRYTIYLFYLSFPILHIWTIFGRH